MGALRWGGSEGGGALKWAIGNALSVQATKDDGEKLTMLRGVLSSNSSDVQALLTQLRYDSLIFFAVQFLTTSPVLAPSRIKVTGDHFFLSRDRFFLT